MNLILLASFVVSAPGLKPLSDAEVRKALVTIDDRLSSPNSDYQARFYVEERDPEKQSKVSQLVVYRRDTDGRMLLVFTKPKTQVGQGYLRLDRNLWFFQPSVGKWNRRSHRDAVVGSAISADFDAWTFSVAYNPTYMGHEKLGAFDAHRIELRVKEGHTEPFPMSHLWIDHKTLNPLKIENRSLSGELIRTVYFPKWAKAKTKGGKYVYYPKQVRIFSSSDKAETILLVQEASLSAVEAGVFTKAWLESQSR